VVFDVVRALGRRWYLVLVGLLLTAGMVYGAYKASPPEYNARALVLLLPSQSEVGRRGNPFLLLNGLEQPAGILAAYLSSAPARAEVETLSPNAEYEVGIDDSTRGPVIVVDVTDETAMDTLKILDHLLKRIPEELARMQQEVDVRESAVIGSMPLTVDREPKADIRGTVRLMIAALVVGVVITGVSAFAMDGRAQRRKLRKRSMEGVTPDENEGDAIPVKSAGDIPPGEDEVMPDQNEDDASREKSADDVRPGEDEEEAKTEDDNAALVPAPVGRWSAPPWAGQHG